MKTRMLALAALAFICIATPAVARQAAEAAATPSPAMAAADDAARAADERMVCERRKAVGSNKVERICKTAKQWRQEREGAEYQAGKQATDRMMQTRSVCANSRCAQGL